ncbi:hypothetical protein OF83DRAFT_932613 [Amylostereum chailletii]|nr:hypothetical protein OF83DRAFT_932613 [Amylostereum chailletii]
MPKAQATVRAASFQARSRALRSPIAQTRRGHASSSTTHKDTDDDADFKHAPPQQSRSTDQASSTSKTASASQSLKRTFKASKSSASGTSQKVVQKQKGKDGKPPPQPEEEWPESDLSIHTTISAGYAKDWYRLNKVDLSVLEFRVVDDPDRPKDYRPMHLYKACEVERQAWKKHGGPAGWKWYLDNLREKYKKNHPNGRFKEPKWIKYKSCGTCAGRVYESSSGYHRRVAKCRVCIEPTNGYPITHHTFQP